MNSEWREVKLEDHVSHKKGFAFKSKDYQTYGIPIVKVKNFTNDSVDITDCVFVDYEKLNDVIGYQLLKDDVVIATVGSWLTNPNSVVGKTVRIPDLNSVSLLNQNAVRLRAKQSINQKFLYFLLKQDSFKYYIVGTAQGSANQASITLKDIFGYTFNLPPLPEQKAIARILGHLDDKIELNRKMNQTLEDMAQALFKSWFVDFDPVIDNALAAGNEIPEALLVKAEKRKTVFASCHPELVEGKAKQSLPTDIKSQFPNSFVFNDILNKWIPEGWEVKTLDDVSTIIGGGTPSTKIDEYYCENGIPWLSPKDLSGYNWKYISKGAKDITQLGLQKSSAKLLPKGTVLFSSRAPIGYIAIAENDVSTNQGFKSLISNKGVPTEYLFQFLKFNISEIDAVATGSTFKEVSGSALKGINIIVPHKDVLEELITKVDSINKRSLLNQNQTETLIKLRDNLLPQLISGKLKVPEAMLVVEEVIE